MALRILPRNPFKRNTRPPFVFHYRAPFFFLMAPRPGQEREVNQRVPVRPDYVFVKKGDPYITRHCRQLTKEMGKDLFVVMVRFNSTLPAHSPTLSPVFFNFLASVPMLAQQDPLTHDPPSLTPAPTPGRQKALPGPPRPQACPQHRPRRRRRHQSRPPRRDRGAGLATAGRRTRHATPSLSCNARRRRRRNRRSYVPQAQRTRWPCRRHGARREGDAGITCTREAQVHRLRSVDAA